MLAESRDEEQIIARVAALDIGKAELVCCVRVPASAGGKRRLQEVSTHSTMTKSLIELANRLVELRVERVVMGGDVVVLEAGVVPIGGTRAQPVVSQRPRCQTSARSTENRCAGCCVVVQGC